MKRRGGSVVNGTVGTHYEKGLNNSISEEENTKTKTSNTSSTTNNTSSSSSSSSSTNKASSNSSTPSYMKATATSRNSARIPRSELLRSVQTNGGTNGHSANSSYSSGNSSHGEGSKRGKHRSGGDTRGHSTGNGVEKGSERQGLGGNTAGKKSSKTTKSGADNFSDKDGEVPSVYLGLGGGSESRVTRRVSTNSVLSPRYNTRGTNKHTEALKDTKRARSSTTFGTSTSKYLEGRSNLSGRTNSMKVSSSTANSGHHSHSMTSSMGGSSMNVSRGRSSTVGVFDNASGSRGMSNGAKPSIHRSGSSEISPVNNTTKQFRNKKLQPLGSSAARGTGAQQTLSPFNAVSDDKPDEESDSDDEPANKTAKALERYRQHRLSRLVHNKGGSSSGYDARKSRSRLSLYDGGSDSDSEEEGDGTGIRGKGRATPQQRSHTFHRIESNDSSSEQESSPRSEVGGFTFPLEGEGSTASNGSASIHTVGSADSEGVDMLENPLIHRVKHRRRYSIAGKVKKVKGWELGEKLGSGAFSTVRMGFLNGEIAAVKIIKGSKVMNQSEVDIWKQLHHDHIVNILDVDEEEDTIYIVME
eukprot:TRINITY_DN658_c0_g3_i5.p1 TRINITY_DN658_c0_g3~~TRINITY_DN658_c0_g3_i5.p1  ORF type:complete len:586 (+),score=106.74 TRINITY_DN658_c0_g3_i5:139-1896(+)